jgi:hypothetical protein
MTNTQIDSRAWKWISPDLWQSTRPGRADVMISLNSTGTMWTVQTADQIGDFFDQAEAFDTANQIVANS